jgi:hypothetical protein
VILAQMAMEPDGLPTPQRYWAAATIWLALTLSVLDCHSACKFWTPIPRGLGGQYCRPNDNNLSCQRGYPYTIALLSLPQSLP